MPRATKKTVAANGDRSNPYDFRMGLAPLSLVNLVEQVRKSYEPEGITELAESIASAGLINEIQVALMTRAQALKYLAFINELWHCNYRLSDLRRLDPRKAFEVRTARGRKAYKPLSETRLERYAVLICGHRRYFALRQLWEIGCEHCRRSYEEEDAGTCFARHFKHGDTLVPVKFYDHIPPYQAMALQYQENIHLRPPPHQQADAYENLFVLAKRRDPDLTLREYARHVGANEETIRRARRYCALSLAIRTDVEQGRYGSGSFGIALELERLQRLLLPAPETLESWRQRAILGRPSVAEFAKEVSTAIKRHQNGEVGFGAEHPEIMGESYLAGMEADARRGVLLHRLVAQLHMGNEYLTRALEELLNGNMGHPGVKFWDTSTISVWRKLLKLLEQIEPLLVRQVAEARQGRAAELANRQVPLLDELANLMAVASSPDTDSLFGN